MLVAPSEGAKVAAPKGATVPPVAGARWSQRSAHRKRQLAREEQIGEPRGAQPTAAPLAGKAAEIFLD